MSMSCYRDRLDRAPALARRQDGRAVPPPRPLSYRAVGTGMTRVREGKHRPEETVRMNVIALVKYIPNPTGTPTMGDDFRLKREGGEGGLDPGDEHVIEAALQVIGGADGEVPFVTMGPEPALAAVRKALSMGGDKGVHVKDDALRGADALATARALAAAIKRSEPFDLVIAGVESTDGYTGTMPASVAEFLGIPSLT